MSICFSQVFVVDTIYYHGDPDNRINLVIIGDGYPNGEISQFRLDTHTVADYFLAIEPFKTYQNFFNFFAIEVVSNESGTDHPGTASDEAIVSQPVNRSTLIFKPHSIGAVLIGALFRTSSHMYILLPM